MLKYTKKLKANGFHAANVPFFFFLRERNKIYGEVCKNRPDNDRFVEKMMQTLNGAAKHKEVQCDKIVMEDKGTLSECQVGNE